MSKAIENLIKAQQFAISVRPKIGGFPYLAEALKQEGVIKNIWNLPSCQSIYLTKYGSVITPGMRLVNTTADIAIFDRDALIKAIKVDQAGESSFPEFLKSAWEAGVISYVVDFEQRIVTYYGVCNESYSENYPAVELKKLHNSI